VGGHQCAKVMDEFSLRNSANYIRTFAIRIPKVPKYPKCWRYTLGAENRRGRLFTKNTAFSQQ